MIVINQYVERIVQKYLQRQNFLWVPPQQIHKGFEKPTRGELEGVVSIAANKTPLIRAICAQADPALPNFQGNWHVHLELAITNSTADADDDTHEDRVDQVLLLFYGDNLLLPFQQIEPQFFFHRLIPGQVVNRIDGISFTTSANFTFLSACAQNMRPF